MNISSELYQLSFPNGKRYIGISTNAKKRFQMHRYQSQQHRHTPLAAAFRKYGAENVTMQVLVIGPRDYILDLEVSAIELYQTRDRKFGYNIAIGGQTSPVEGVGHSEASRAKMSISQKRRVRTPEEIAAFAGKGRKIVFTPEHKERLRLTALERWARPGEREKQSHRIKGV